MTDGVKTALPDAGSVAEAPSEALPDLPVPVETPDVPEVRVPAPLPPASKPPAPASTPPASSAGEAASDGAGGAEATEGVAVPPGAEGPGALPGPGARSEPGARMFTPKPGQGSIDPAEAAPLRRLRAYVWPAIALRVVVGDVLMPLARFGGSLNLHVPDVFGLRLPSPVARPGGIASSPERLNPPSRDLQAPSDSALPGAGVSLLVTLLIVFLMGVGLVALARLVVGEELFETRPWRGHRS